MALVALALGIVRIGAAAEPVEHPLAAGFALGALRLLLLGPLLLLLGDLDLRVGVGLANQRLPARPAEHPHDEDERERDVPGGRDQLLRGRVVDGRALWHVAAGVERERVRGLGDPDRARRDRDDVRERAGADHPHDRREGDRDGEGRQEDRDHGQLAEPREERGQEDAGRVALWCLEDGPARLRLYPQGLDLAPEDARHDDDQEAAAREHEDRSHRVVVEAVQRFVEGARDGEEEVEVDERAGEREEDLLDEICRQRAREGAGRDDGHEHEQRHEGADVRRQEVVHRDPDRVGGHDGADLDVPGIRGAQDAVVGEAGKDRLRRLDGECEDDVAGRDLPDLVPEVLEPPDDVDPEEVEDHDDERGPEQPGGHLDQASATGRVLERKNLVGRGGRGHAGAPSGSAAAPGAVAAAAALARARSALMWTAADVSGAARTSPTIPKSAPAPSVTMRTISGLSPRVAPKAIGWRMF